MYSILVKQVMRIKNLVQNSVGTPMHFHFSRMFQRNG